MADVSVVSHGSLVGLTLLTQEAIDWADEHLPDDAPQIGNTVFAEPRYADPIIEGMRDDGLEVV